MTKYDTYVPIGNKCISATALEKLGLRKESFPLDWIMIGMPTVLHLFTNHFNEFYPLNNAEGDYINHDFKEYLGFEHFADKTHAENHITFQRRVQKLYDILESNKSVLFVYTTESFLYHKWLRDQEPEHYQALLDLDHFLSSNYSQLKYRILAIHTNTVHENSGNIVNITFNYPHVSDNGETHREPFLSEYRASVTKLIKVWLGIPFLSEYRASFAKRIKRWMSE